MKGQRLENAVVVAQEDKTVRWKKVSVIMIHHNDFQQNGEDTLLCAHPRHFRMAKKGPPEAFFGTASTEEDEDGILAQQTMFPEELHATPRTEHVALARANGTLVDDDNEPTPENIPATNPSNEVLKDWDKGTGICPQKRSSALTAGPCLPKWLRDSTLL